MPNLQDQATDELSKYAVATAAPDELERYAAAEKKTEPAAKPAAAQSSIGPRPAWQPGKDVPMPLFETIENYTPEGRKAHPILSRLGDATRNAKDMLRTVGPEISLLSLAPGGMNPAISELGAPRTAAAPTRLSPIKRAPEEIYQRPIEAAPGAGKGPAPAEMHPEELAAIRKEAGNPAMSPEDAHRFRISKTASAAASTKPANDLGGMARAGEEPGRLQRVGEKARAPRGYFNLGRGSAGPTVEQVVNDAMGVKPLEPNVPLREQAANGEVAPAVDPIKVKYPDPAVRQMVRANGEKIVDAVGKNPALMKQIHDLTRVDLRQALVNAGEDMGQQTVSNSKFAGEGSIGRQEAFDRLLAKGHSPDKIVELAKQKPEGPAIEEAPASKPESQKAGKPEAAAIAPNVKVESIEERKPSRLGAQRETRERAGRIRAARLNP